MNINRWMTLIVCFSLAAMTGCMAPSSESDGDDTDTESAERAEDAVKPKMGTLGLLKAKAGDVKLAPADGSAWSKPVKAGQPINKGDSLSLGPYARAVIKCANGRPDEHISARDVTQMHSMISDLYCK